MAKLGVGTKRGMYSKQQRNCRVSSVLISLNGVCLRMLSGHEPAGLHFIPLYSDISLRKREWPGFCFMFDLLSLCKRGVVMLTLTGRGLVSMIDLLSRRGWLAVRGFIESCI